MKDERSKRAKRIGWVSLVVDVGIMSVAISRTSSRVFYSSKSKKSRSPAFPRPCPPNDPNARASRDRQVHAFEHQRQSLPVPHGNVIKDDFSPGGPLVRGKVHVRGSNELR